MILKSILYLIVLLGLAAAASADSGLAGSEELLWPLPVEPRAITGTFMEFRQGRFHSGMDLRTQGREGLPVLAPADGSIVRLRTSPTGYGVAVYLQLDDGRMLVFGHLSALSDRLRLPVLRAWKKTGRYQQYLYLKPGELRVERGELLALSGSTGVGAPHLHLEVRDAQEHPLNPQLQGFAAPDTVAPRVTEIRVIPLGQGALVDGERAAKVFESGTSFTAVGMLGVMVRIDDRTGYSPFRVGPLGVAVELDGEEVYRLENKRFDFSQTGQMRLEEFDDPENPKKTWMRLYRRPGNELPDRSEFGPPGATFVARKGHEHELVIRAWDVGGRTGESRWAIRGTQRAFVQPIPWYSLEGEWKPGKGADDPWPAEWVLSRGEPGVKYGEMTDDLPASDSEPVLHGWYLSVAEDGLFPGGMWKYSCPPPPEQGPEGTSGYLSLDGVGFDGDGIVVNKGFDIEVYFSAGAASKVGLFQYNSTGKWIFLDSERTETPEEGVVALRASTESLGPLALARDTTPPELGSFRIGERLLSDGETLRSVTREQQRGVTLPDWPSVRIDVKDLATGIPEDGLTTLLDGEPWPARWEPEDEVLVYEWWLDPGPGEHELTVQAQDGLGNASESSIRLVFPR